MAPRDEQLIDLNLLMTNDKEWRKHILIELSTVKDAQTNILVKVAVLETKFLMIGGFFGLFGGFLSSVVIEVLKK